MSDAVLVIGAAGFIGRHLSEALAGAGKAVIAATRTPVRFEHPGIHNAVGDFSAPGEFLPLLGQCRWVVHAAATSTPGSSAGDPLAELTTLTGTLALLHAMQERESQASLIYISSGGTLYGDQAGARAAEHLPIAPRSYHGAGKAAAEAFIQAWAAQYRATAIVLRPSNVFGPGQEPRPGFGIIPAAFQHVLDGTPITLWGDGSAVRDYLYVDDLVSLCVSAIDAARPQGMHVFNASRGEGVPLGDLLDKVESVTGRPLHRVHAPARAGDIQHVVPDNTAAREAFGWQPRTDLDQGLRETWRWFTTPR